MKKIGFIDYYLDEWHANNYPAWIRDRSWAAGLDLDVAYAWAETCRPDGLDTAAWCDQYGVTALDSIAEIVDKSDCLIVLSPDNPERHEDLARLPLMSGKPVYIDKTFSAGLQPGIRMFDLAARHGTPMFSSSALRFAKELAGYPDDRVSRSSLEYVAALGPGHFDNYAVHQLEMIVSLLGPDVDRIKSLSTGNARSLTLEYRDGRRASMLQMPALPFELSLQLNSGENVFVGQCSDFFPRLIGAMLIFFETGRAPVPREETLAIMALIDAGQLALVNDDIWIKVAKSF